MSSIVPELLKFPTIVNTTAPLVSESDTAAAAIGTAIASFINGTSSVPATSVGSSSTRDFISPEVATSVPPTTAVAPTSVFAGIPSSHQNSSTQVSLPLSSVVQVVTSAAARSSAGSQPSDPVSHTRLPLPPVDPASATTGASVSSGRTFSFSPVLSSARASSSLLVPTTHRPVPPVATSVAQPTTSSFSAKTTPSASTSTTVDMSPKASRRINVPPSGNKAVASAAASSASDSGSSSPSTSASTPVDTPAKGSGPSSDPGDSSSASKTSPPFSLPVEPAPSSTSESSQKSSPTVKAHTDTQSAATSSSSVSPTTHSSDPSPSPSKAVAQPSSNPPSSPSHTDSPSITSSDSPSQPLFQVPTQSFVPQPAPIQSGNFRATSVSTVQEPPESTFSSPVFVTSTDSKGKPTLSIPPVITSVGVSTEPDGVLVSVTHIIANPTGIWGISDTTPATKHGFLSNGGAVAGVFVVVGIIVAAIAAIVSFIMCKRRRRRRIRSSISKPLPMPANPFEDPRESPSPAQMRYSTPSGPSQRNVVGAGLGLSTQPRPGRNLLDDEIEEIPGPVMAHTAGDRINAFAGAAGDRTSGIAGVGAGGKSTGRPAYNTMPSYTGPFSSYANTHMLTHSARPSYGSSSIGVAITSDEPQQPQKLSTLANIPNTNNEPPTPPPRLKHASLTPSTPSIYPPSLPNIDDSTDSATITDDTHNFPITPSTDEAIHLPLGTVDLNTSESPDHSPVVRRRPAPPLPPRSPLRPSSKHGENTLNLVISTQLSPQAPEADPAASATKPAPVPVPTSTSTPGELPPSPTQEKPQEYEPITPPASTISFDSTGSIVTGGRESRQSDIIMPKPISARPSPTMSTFEEYNIMMARKTSLTGRPIAVEGHGKKENFYTRRKVVNTDLARRTSVEWKN